MNDQSFFMKMFARRSVFCFFTAMFLFLTCILRVAAVATGSYAAAQRQQNNLRLTLTRPRGTIYDCNMLPLTNRTQKIVAAVAPTPYAVTAISTALREDAALPGVLSRLSTGKPVLCELPRAVEGDGIVCATVFVHSDTAQPAGHIIGYVGGDGHGVTGLEAAYDDLLYSDTTLDAVYEIDGRGDPLMGVAARLEGGTVQGNSVVTTLDSNIQNIAEQAAVGIDCGAVVVCEAKTGKIRALVSRPSYDVTRVSEYLTREDAPLLNRALSAYSVGSVFKPCVAAAGIEAGLGGIWHECTGSTEIAGRVFRCHKIDGHGLVNLRLGVALSCNSYFYRFAIRIGGRPIYNMASSLGFGGSIALADGLSASGVLTPLETLTNDAALANLSIGQGSLLLSPVSMLTLYCAIANDGSYSLPTLIETVIQSGRREEVRNASPTRVMRPETAALLRDYLAAVIAEGTGTAAAPKLCTAAGKTATAQTGRYKDNGVEITHGWFCGFFPAEEPEYVVVVLSEDSGGGDAATVFADIADRITEYAT